jgi:hypothetical protein
MTLWSWRFTPARGWHWRIERDVTEETQAVWLAIFQRDEPDVRFVVSDKLPKEPS